MKLINLSEKEFKKFADKHEQITFHQTKEWANLKANNGWNYATEILCYRLGLPSQKTGACQIALDVFCELGILIYNEGKYIIPKESVKSALENSEIFKRATE